ncbi:hypothetical protein KL929_001260 [Ogataea haglerorum]|nr:hypothetical protein KL951_001338 [Ogataea haglerorum]KAG7721287.1 hypothetical protein KL913_001023 [Ogataea haglerorum]KAG7722041.1 hypothetical protein KL949_001019 [Ogataea haglerorum]KAG7740183.1 hypothetical protein KL923_002024 [Ogataea haglerorum]KAG7770370.1 hypothetical protein KL931_002134 [Ogataea haglerorum]
MERIDLTVPENYATQTLLLICQTLFDCLHSSSGKNFDMGTILQRTKENPLMKDSPQWTPSESQLLALYNNLMLENGLIDSSDKDLEFYRMNEPLVIEICERLYNARVSELRGEIEENKEKFGQLMQIVKGTS